jgi:hypothetical protein
VWGVGDFEITGNDLLQENGDVILLETGFAILLEDASTVGTAAGIATVSGVGARLYDAVGTVSAAAATVAGVMEVPGTADNLLKEDGDDILLETGEFLLKEDGTTVPTEAVLDVDGFPILDTTGDYIIGV